MHVIVVAGKVLQMRNVGSRKFSKKGHAYAYCSNVSYKATSSQVWARRFCQRQKRLSKAHHVGTAGNESKVEEFALHTVRINSKTNMRITV